VECALPVVTVLTLIWLHIEGPATRQGREPCLVYVLVRAADVPRIPGLAVQNGLLAHAADMPRDYSGLLRTLDARGPTRAQMSGGTLHRYERDPSAILVR
jgi:hypothetical protein